MSDLGPFVAAHLRDKVIADLLQENKQLKKELHNARRVSITGPGGSTVYAEGDFSKGRYDPLVMPGEWWEIPFASEPGKYTSKSCTLSMLPTCEVRIGGFVKIKMGDVDRLCVCDYSRELSMVKVKYCNLDPCFEVGVHIPMCEELFLSIHSRTHLRDLGSSFFVDLIPTDQDLPVIFEELIFHADCARQALLDFGIENVEWLDREDLNEGPGSTETLGKSSYGTPGGKSSSAS